MPRRVLITFQLIIPIRVHSWRRKLIQHRAFLFVCLFTDVCKSEWGKQSSAFKASGRHLNDGRHINQTPNANHLFSTAALKKCMI